MDHATNFNSERGTRFGPSHARSKEIAKTVVLAVGNKDHKADVLGGMCMALGTFITIMTESQPESRPELLSIVGEMIHHAMQSTAKPRP